MTDSDILEALKAQIRVSDTVGVNYCDGVPKRFFVRILDLINRQKAEIDCLQKELLEKMYDFETEYDSKIKAEAIKEFAERLKERKYQSSGWLHGEHPFVVEESDIDDLLEEMVGE